VLVKKANNKTKLKLELQTVEKHRLSLPLHECARPVRKKTLPQSTRRAQRRDKSLFKKELGKIENFFKISIFRFWNVRAPFDVEKEDL